MPLYDYVCPVGHAEERLCAYDAPRYAPCSEPGCTLQMRRAVVYRLNVVGPVYSNMERYERALLSPTERAAGVHLSGPSDINAREDALHAEHGLVRQDEGSVAARAAREDAMDEVSTRQRVAREAVSDGRSPEHAELDWVAKQEIQAEVGWGDAQYGRWKDASDGAARHAEAARAIVDADG